MGISPEMTFPASTLTIPECARIFIFSDGFWSVAATGVSGICRTASQCSALARTGPLSWIVLTRVCELRGSIHLDDDFSFIERLLADPQLQATSGGVFRQD
jgi:hypothetical protein